MDKTTHGRWDQSFPPSLEKVVCKYFEELMAKYAR
jgi:hypothetical protein